MSAAHGDCKNDNKGKHNGYDCPVPDQNDNSTPPVDNPPPPVIYAS